MTAKSSVADRKKTSARAKGSGSPSGLGAKLKERVAASILPADTTFDSTHLADVASFLLDAAKQRDGDEPVIVLESASEAHRYMRIAVINDDMPFLVDSVAATIAGQGLVIDRLVHPVVPVRRDAKGRLTDVPSGLGEKRESMIYLETARVDARQRRGLRDALAATLADVRAAVTDWPKMQAAMLDDAERVSDAEGAALLRWLAEGMLTQLGHVTRRRDGSHAQLLGICRKGMKALLADDSYDRAFHWFSTPEAGGRGRAPLIIKANRIATVHRHVPLDLFIVPVIENGQVAALSIHAGVWTSVGLTTPPDRVPRMRTQLAELVERLDFDAGSHDAKSLIHALTTMPHDLVIGFSDADIERVATAMMSLVDRPRPRLALVEAPLARHLFAFVWLPRDLLSTSVRLQIRDLLSHAAKAEVLDWSLEVEGGNLATLRFVLDIRDGAKAPDEAKLDEALQAMLRGWGEAVESELALTEDPARAAAIAARYADAFPQQYRGEYGPADAAIDIQRLRGLASVEGDHAAATRRDARLYRRHHDTDQQLRLKIYQHEGSMPLSDAVPALENFGFRVLAELPTQLDHGATGTIHDFTLALPQGDHAGPLLDRAEAIEQAIAAVLNGTAEDDPFNRLVLASALSAVEANWLRAFYRYLRQAGMGFTIYTVVDALDRAPAVTRGLIALLVARHDPAFSGDRDAAAEDAETAIRDGLAKVAAINDDRLLRLYRSAFVAILRTNAFAPAGEQALAFKLDSALVPGLPKPVPWREIWVYARRVEGIHLRAGPIARGGIRWSDRRDDFRTEILGLMKAQRVKNAVIVPTGAKGGFYPKRLPDPARDRDGWAAEGQASYEIFIRALLSVTDNIVKDKVVHPDGVVIHDGDDPYFVVAADKGTARFSDVANAIAEAEDFWLDDAFASGGSHGYDHKEMGITARGAWLSVQRHFREMGVDVQKDQIRVAGCGDMSGDVFGNGMLLSKTLKLVAAFDHRHIFIDPDPDPAKSWAERQRLFDLPRSSWDDYDKTLISKGGGVFAKTMKRIALSVEARRALGLEDTEVDPDTLISAVLKAPVDLMWFGGIGTYIKAESENNVAVGDPANDALRIDGAMVRAKVVGEGANLGCTQAGRIEFALHGGRINTDFIDNSAGVDCSDHEVNIKIALAAARRAGKISEKARNALLVEMTDAVAALVLEDNRLQALALSIAETGGSRATAAQVRLIEMLEDAGELDRKTEGLAASDQLARRAADGHGLTRPELAVLLSSTKLVIQDAIEASDLPEDPGLVDDLLEAFPEPLRDRYARFIKTHRLRRELIATILSNQLVNRLGMVHPFELAEEEGSDLAEVTAAFVAAKDLFKAEAIWADLDRAAMAETARLLLFDRVAVALRSQMADLLRAGAGPVQPSVLRTELTATVDELAKGTDTLLASESREQSARLRKEFADAGAPDTAVNAVAHLFDMDGAVGLARLASKAEINSHKLTEAFTALGSRLGLDWAQGTAAMMRPSDPWERLLVAGLARDFQQMRFDFLARMARRKGAKDDPAATVEAWMALHEAAIAQFRGIVGRAQTAPSVAPAMLAQIASMARNLLGR